VKTGDHHLMHVTGGPDIAFTGHMVAQFVEPGHDHDGANRHEVRLWRSVGGALIAECALVYASDARAPRRHALVLTGSGIDPEQPSAATQEAVMEFFQWSAEAKALARRLGWDVVRHVE
jgi:hypothetical protein